MSTPVIDPLRLPGVKQGTSFNIYADYALGVTAEVFAPTDLTCQVRRANGEKVCQLTIAGTATAGRYLLSATPTQTLTWPVGDVYFDIKRDTGNSNVDVTKTKTVVMAVEKKVTV